MMSATSDASRLDHLVWRFGRNALTASFILSVALVAAITTLAPDLVIWIPLVPLGLTAAWYLFRHPLLNLCVAIGTFALVAGFEEGIDPGEVAYGIYYVTFLGVWFFRRMFLYREPILKTTVDRLVAFVIFWVVLYALISPFFGTRVIDAINELQSWTMLAFYFPVKDALVKYDNASKALLAVFIMVGLFVVFRNTITLADKLARATMAWQVTQKGRVVTNEMLMMVPAFGAICRSFQVKGLTTRLSYYAVFLVLIFGLIMTQGRGYWLAFAFGSAILFFIVDGKSRVRLVTLALTGLAGTVLLLWTAFGDVATLLFAGLWNRILSIGTAASADVSLINRFVEWEVLIKDILKNPIMGYGMARPFPFVNILFGTTEMRTFTHNGFLSLWYQFGIVGLFSVLAAYYHSIRGGIAVARSALADPFERALAAMAAISLAGTLVSTIPSNAWFNSDTLFYTGLLFGIVSGTRENLKREA